MQKLTPFLLSLTVLSFLFSACSENVQYPRPIAYPRVDLPQEVKYIRFESETCPFTFEYPSIGEVSRNNSDSCWVDIYFPAYRCKWHVGYRNVEETGKDRDVHYEEWRKLIYKHSKKASQIQASPIQKENGTGYYYDVFGNVGTPSQFFFADPSETEIVMTSFYYFTAKKQDSLLPVTDFMKEHLDHMVESIQW